MRDNLHGDVFRLRGRFVTHVVNVPAAQVREAFACTEGFERAVVVVNGERSLCDCDHARAWMRVPPSLTPGLERHLGEIHIRIASDPREEKPIR